MITRRQATQSALVAALVVGAVKGSLAADKPQKTHTFVLVHGAWHGGWCWKYVRDYLEDQGHRVFTPSLTGHGDRRHLRSPDVNLDTHIMDIINLMTWEELDNFVLVGHSYAGFIITAVCDRVKERIGHVVYLDSFVPKNGDTVLPTPTKEFAEERYGPLEDGYLAYAREPVSFGIPETMTEELAWLRRRLTPQLLGTWLQPVSLTNGGSDGIPRTFIYCNDKPPLSDQQAARLQRFKDDPTWNYTELPCGHDAMVILPNETAQIFESVADRI